MANYHVHYQKLRNYHWNVEGHFFFELHEFFELEYNAVKLQIDEIAERIRVFGKKPVSTLKEYLEMSIIKETDTSLNSKEMAKEILNDFETLISLCIEAHETIANEGDLATSDLLIAYIKRTEKSHWMLSSFVNNSQKAPMPLS
ncbi:Dps family protein [Gillisia sp. Q332]|uniref:Dps family protein n=1 Tax=Gillisia xinjiangensis TaxID=3384765 RepID=UPI0039198225